MAVTCHDDGWSGERRLLSRVNDGSTVFSVRGGRATLPGTFLRVYTCDGSQGRVGGHAGRVPRPPSPFFVGTLFIWVFIETTQEPRGMNPPRLSAHTRLHPPIPTTSCVAAPLRQNTLERARERLVARRTRVADLLVFSQANATHLPAAPSHPYQFPSLTVHPRRDGIVPTDACRAWPRHRAAVTDT